MRTYSPKAGEITRNWHVIDATDVVLGRLATYSGKIVSMDQALKTKSTMPDNISWNSEAPTSPDEDGFYAAAAIPGNYRIS